MGVGLAHPEREAKAYGTLSAVRQESARNPPLEVEPSTDDLAILQEVIEGRLESFDILVNRHKSQLIAYLFSRLRDEHIAEDLAQEVFLRVFRAARKGQYNQSRKDLRAWLFTIARHLIVDYQRQQNRRPATPAGEAWRLDNPAPAAADPSQKAIQAEQKQFVERVLDQLPEAQREVVELKIYGELTFAQIAEAVNVSVPTVKSRMRYAMTKVYTLLKDREQSLL